MHLLFVKKLCFSFSDTLKNGQGLFDIQRKSFLVVVDRMDNEEEKSAEGTPTPEASAGTICYFTLIQYVKEFYCPI